MPPPPIPRATYRLQLHAGFTFADAEAVVPYLAELGISHLYLSPFLKARTGSDHGYDIVDHNAFNPAIGDRAALARLAATLERYRMGILMDVVPNHMGIGGAENLWWLNVLEWGPDSPYARYFDIDWQPARRELKGKVLLPFLGDHYGIILEKGELVPRFDPKSGTIGIWYWEHLFPVAVRDYADLLDPAAHVLGLGPDGDALRHLVADMRVFSGAGVARSASVRYRRGIALKARLAETAQAHPRIKSAIDDALRSLAGTPGEPASFQALHDLLERQSYRVSYWRVAADEINYRRFFNINDLAALRVVEEPDLFDRVHALAFDLIGAGLVHGLRIDHVDGLFNPADYCRRIQRKAADALGRPLAGMEDQPLYVVAEKILATHEHLRHDWPVAGTTGYDFLNQVCGLFVAADGEGAIGAIYGDFIGAAPDFDREVYDAKTRVIERQMTSELRLLALRLGRLALSRWRSRDFTLSVLYGALREVVACLPVYRTYVTSRRVTDADRSYIAWAVAKALKRAGADPSVFTFVRGILDTSLGRDGEGAYSRRAVVDFAMRWQQYTGAVMAKGFEDTVLYRYNRLLCLNEVGGDPTRFGISPGAFHHAARERLRNHPLGLLATATHDTKRGEDTRIRIAALSEVPEEWGRHLERWHRLNAPFRRALDSGPAPDPNDEIFLYQTMLGAWPDDAGAEESVVERLAAAMVKSVKEAKRRTSWSNPDEAYEKAVADFARRICERDRINPFLDDFRPFQARIAALGRVNGLGQTLIKLTVPGVPDIYQGTEFWDLSLVDPDNRRPVDYNARRRRLGSLAGTPLPADPEGWRDGAVKQELIRRALDLRRRMPDLFAHGAYRPLTVRGAGAGGVLAFARQNSDGAVVVAVPLHLARFWPPASGAPPLGPAWRAMHIDAPRRGAGGGWRNLLGDNDVPVVTRRGVPVLLGPDLFAAFPLALLVPVE